VVIDAPLCHPTPCAFDVPKVRARWTSRRRPAPTASRRSPAAAAPICAPTVGFRPRLAPTSSPAELWRLRLPRVGLLPLRGARHRRLRRPLCLDRARAAAAVRRTLLPPRPRGRLCPGRRGPRRAGRPAPRIPADRRLLPLRRGHARAAPPLAAPARRARRRPRRLDDAPGLLAARHDAPGADAPPRLPPPLARLVSCIDN
jgi:hypothetical protein